MKHRRFESEAQFVAVQNAWRNWGIGLAIVGFVVGIALDIVLISSGALLSHHRYG